MIALLYPKPLQKSHVPRRLLKESRLVVPARQGRLSSVSGKSHAVAVVSPSITITTPLRRPVFISATIGLQTVADI